MGGGKRAKRLQRKLKLGEIRKERTREAQGDLGGNKETTQHQRGGGLEREIWAGWLGKIKTISLMGAQETKIPHLVLGTLGGGKWKRYKKSLGGNGEGSDRSNKT